MTMLSFVIWMLLYHIINTIELYIESKFIKQNYSDNVKTASAIIRISIYVIVAYLIYVKC